MNNPFKKNVLMTAPACMKQWCLDVNPGLGLYRKPALENIHALLPREYIYEKLDIAAQKTTARILLKIVNCARLEGLCQSRDNTIDQFIAFLKKIIWVKGNCVPGPCKHQCIDYLRVESKRERHSALFIAEGYARNLALVLERLSATPTLERWQALIELVKTSSQKNIKAQQDIIKWGDAWGTHSEYKIYIKLSKDEVIQARNNSYMYREGAWILPQHPRIKKMAQVLMHWQNKVNATQGCFLIDTVHAMRSSLESPFCEKWLTKHEWVNPILNTQSSRTICRSADA